MIPINHILVLSQPEFVHQQLKTAMFGEPWHVRSGAILARLLHHR